MPVQVARRRGCDLYPLDVTSPGDCERLLAYVWPDHADRLARLKAATEVATADPLSLDKAAAAAWTELALDPGTSATGVADVLMHAVAFRYAPEKTSSRIAAYAARVGAAATGEAPIAWLRFEAEPEFGERSSLRLTLWPGGGERVLALGDSHGEALQWLG